MRGHGTAKTQKQFEDALKELSGRGIAQAQAAHDDRLFRFYGDAFDTSCPESESALKLGPPPG
ncbi:MAG: hypothetical protein NVSMB26_26720 [Beijerinckiaceae bacterium]